MNKLFFYIIFIFSIFCHSILTAQTKIDQKKLDKLFWEGRYQEVLSDYKILFNQDNKNLDLNFRYGTCLLFESDSASKVNYAVNLLSFACSKPEAIAEYHYFLGRALHVNCEYQKAIDQFNLYKSKKNKQTISFPVDEYLIASTNALSLKPIGKSNFDKIGDAPPQPFKENFYPRDNINVHFYLVPIERVATKIDKKNFHIPTSWKLDGTKTRYFSSYGTNDDGNKDLYVLSIEDEKEVITKLPKLINSDLDEDYPFFEQETNFLYFSSKGHNSGGGYDLFRAEFDTMTNSFIRVENLGPGISTPYDDILFVYYPKSKKALFSSNKWSRQGNYSFYSGKVEFDQKLYVLKQNIISRLTNEINPNIKLYEIEVRKQDTQELVGKFNSNENGDVQMELEPGNYTYSIILNGSKDDFKAEISIYESDKIIEQNLSYSVDEKNNESIVITDNLSETPNEILAQNIQKNQQENKNFSEEKIIVESEIDASKEKEALAILDMEGFNQNEVVDAVADKIIEIELTQKENQQLMDNLNVVIINNRNYFDELQTEINTIESKLAELSPLEKIEKLNIIQNLIADQNEVRNQTMWMQVLNDSLHALNSETNPAKRKFEEILKLGDQIQLLTQENKYADAYNEIIKNHQDIKSQSTKTAYEIIYNSLLENELEQARAEKKILALSNELNTFNDQLKNIEIEIINASKKERIQLEEQKNQLLQKINSNQKQIKRLKSDLEELKVLASDLQLKRNIISTVSKEINENPVTYSEAKIKYFDRSQVNKNKIIEIEDQIKSNLEILSSIEKEIVTLTNNYNSEINSIINPESSNEKLIEIEERFANDLQKILSSNSNFDSIANRDLLENYINEKLQESKTKISSLKENENIPTDNSSEEVASNKEPIDKPLNFNSSKNLTNNQSENENATNDNQLNSNNSNNTKHLAQNQQEEENQSENENVSNDNQSNSNNSNNSKQLAQNQQQEENQSENENVSNENQSNTANSNNSKQLAQNQKEENQHENENENDTNDNQSNSSNSNNFKQLTQNQKEEENQSENENVSNDNQLNSNNSNNSKQLAQNQQEEENQRENENVSNDNQSNSNNSNNSKQLAQNQQEEENQRENENEKVTNDIQSYSSNSNNSKQFAQNQQEEENQSENENKNETNENQSNTANTNNSMQLAQNQQEQNQSENENKNVTNDNQSNSNNSNNSKQLAQNQKEEENQSKNENENVTNGNQLNTNTSNNSKQLAQNQQEEGNQRENENVSNDNQLNTNSSNNSKQLAQNQQEEENQSENENKNETNENQSNTANTNNSKQLSQNQKNNNNEEIKLKEPNKNSDQTKRTILPISNEDFSQLTPGDLEKNQLTIAEKKENLINEIKNTYPNLSYKTEQQLIYEKSKLENELLILSTRISEIKSSELKVKNKNDKIKREEELLTLETQVSNLENQLNDINSELQKEQKQELYLNQAPKITSIEKEKQEEISALETYKKYVSAVLEFENENENYIEIKKKLESKQLELNEVIGYHSSSKVQKKGIVEFGELITEIDELKRERENLYKNLEAKKNIVESIEKENEQIKSELQYLTKNRIEPMKKIEVVNDPIISSGGFQISNQNTTNPVMKEPIPLNVKTPSGLVYRVQVGAFRKPLQNNVYSGFTPVSGELQENGLTIYLAGYFNGSTKAVDARKQIQQLGYADAFVVAYCNGKKISLGEARQLEARGECRPLGDNDFLVEISKNTQEALKLQTNSIDSQNNPTSENSQSRYNSIDLKNLYFTVQIGVYNTSINEKQKFPGLTEISSNVSPKKQIRYSTGKFSDIENAKTRKNLAVASGISDAFIVAYYRGERITIAQANELIAKNGNSILETTSQNSPNLISKINYEAEDKKYFTEVKKESKNKKIKYEVNTVFNEFPIEKIAFLNKYALFQYNSLTEKIETIELSEKIDLDNNLKFSGFISRIEQTDSQEDNLQKFKVTDELNGDLADFFLRTNCIHSVEKEKEISIILNVNFNINENYTNLLKNTFDLKIEPYVK